MKRLLIPSVAVVAVVAAAVVAITANGSGRNENGPASAAPASPTTTVSTQEIGDRRAVLVDSAGKPLYVTDQENAAGRVLCMDGCTPFWVPLTVDDGAPTGSSSVSGELGVVERPDSARQVTLDGMLLYTFVRDEPGEVTGEGFEDVFDGQLLTWRVVRADGSVSSRSDTRPTGRYGRFGS